VRSAFSGRSVILRRNGAELFDTTAEGNAVVVRQLLAERGVDVDVRVVQRALQPPRQQKRAAEVATVRIELFTLALEYLRPTGPTSDAKRSTKGPCGVHSRWGFWWPRSS
jgi:hypothetical protein